MNTPLKIVLAAGIFFPDVGGPAIHTRKIAEAIYQKGIPLHIIAYGDSDGGRTFPFPVCRVSRTYPGPLRWLFYFFKVLYHAWGASHIYAFDPTAAGIPARIASIILRKKFLIRIGGDPIWERAVEKGKHFMSIGEYYEKDYHRKDKLALFLAIRWLIRSSKTIVTYNQLLKSLYVDRFGARPECVHIIKNPLNLNQSKSSPPLPFPPIFLFAGRFVSYKNILMVIKAFDYLYSRHHSGKLELIGKGPDEVGIRALISSVSSKENIHIYPSMPQEQLFNKIKMSSVCLAPALTEFNPNFILEGLSLGRPAIISRGHGLTVELPLEWQFDPKNLNSLIQVMEKWYDREYVARTMAIVGNMDSSISWEYVTGEHLKLLGIS